VSANRGMIYLEWLQSTGADLGAPQAAQTFEVMLPGTLTQIGDTLYDAASGGNVVTQPITTDANGISQLFVECPSSSATGHRGSVKLYNSTLNLDRIVEVKPDGDNVAYTRGSGTYGAVRTDARSWGYSTANTAAANDAALVAALAAADVVYIPPGIAPVSAVLDVTVGKTIWSETLIQAPAAANNAILYGAVLKATAATTAVVTLSGGTVEGVNADANNLATSAFGFTTGVNRGYLINCRGGNATTQAVLIDGGQCNIYGGAYAMNNTGTVFKYSNAKADLIMTGVRGNRGDTILDCDGGFAQITGCHFTGHSGSNYLIDCAGGSNHFTDIYLDNAKTAILLQAGASRNGFSQLKFVNVSTTVGNPVILVNSSGGTCDRNRISNWELISQQFNPNYFYQESGGASTNTNLGDGSMSTAITFGTGVMSTVPAMLGRIVDNAGAKVRNEGRTSVADGGTISHGLMAAPAWVICTPITSGEFVSVTAMGATTFTVAIKKHDGTAGTTQFVNWQCALI
jgi:hypothetical protein